MSTDTTNAFDVDRARLGAAAVRLPPEHFDEFQRLAKTLVHGPRFQFVICDCEDERLRARVLAALDEVLRAAQLSSSTLMLGPDAESAAALEAQLVEQASEHDVVHVLGAASRLDDAQWEALNVRRERIAHTARARLVFWLTPDAVKRLSRCAPDVWAWRSGVYAFERSAAPVDKTTWPLPVPFDDRSGIDPRGKTERHRRIAELRAALDGDAAFDDELRAALLDELAQLHAVRGRLDEALRIRKSEELQLYERLGDMRSKAITHGRIADILHAQGQLDEALRIRKEEELPVYERLGDVRLKAVTQGKIADILQARDQPDEALRILEAEVLTSFERLGDVRLTAITQGRIADILQSKGELDEALRIHKEEELPVYERLGDVRSRAITQGRIAGILQARGQFDEALRIRREEQLPVYERVGDVRERAVCMTEIALALHERKTPGDRLEAERLLTVALDDATQSGLVEAESIGRWLRVVQTAANA